MAKKIFKISEEVPGSVDLKWHIGSEVKIKRKIKLGLAISKI